MKTLYLADSNPGGNQHLLAFPLKDDGTVGTKKVLHDFGKDRGIDGMCVDAKGNIYGAAGSGKTSGVYVFTPEGKQIAFIPVPGDADQLRLRRQGPQDALHHGRQVALSHQGANPRLRVILARGEIMRSTVGLLLLLFTSAACAEVPPTRCEPPSPRACAASSRVPPTISRTVNASAATIRR